MGIHFKTMEKVRILPGTWKGVESIASGYVVTILFQLNDSVSFSLWSFP